MVLNKSFSRILGTIAVISIVTAVPLFFMEDIKPFLLAGAIFFSSSLLLIIMKILDSRYREHEPLQYDADDNQDYIIEMSKSFDRSDYIDVSRQGSALYRLYAGCHIAIDSGLSNELTLTYLSDKVFKIAADDYANGLYLYNLYDGLGLRIADLSQSVEIERQASMRYKELNKEVNSIYYRCIVGWIIAFIMFVVHAFMVLQP